MIAGQLVVRKGCKKIGQLARMVVVATVEAQNLRGLQQGKVGQVEIIKTMLLPCWWLKRTSHLGS